MKNPKVSDHALIRYFERHHGLNFNATRQEILSKSVRAAIKCGADGVKTDIGTFKISGNTVTTFTKNGRP